jgi:hypothetical protein
MNGDEEVILDDDENVHEVLKEKFRGYEEEETLEFYR